MGGNQVGKSSDQGGLDRNFTEKRSYRQVPGQLIYSWQKDQTRNNQGILLMIIQRQPPFLKFNPVQVFRRHPVLFHGNAVIHRAYQFAEITTHAFFIDHGIGVIGIPVFQPDGLVGSVFTGNIT